MLQEELIMLDERVVSVWLVGLGTLSGEEFAFNRESPMSALMDAHEIGDKGFHDPEAESLLRSDLYTFEEDRRLMDFAKKVKRKLSGKGRMSHRPRDLSRGEFELVTGIEELSDTVRFSSLEFSTDGIRVEVDFQVLDLDIKKVSELKKIFQLSRYELPKSIIIDEIRSTNLRWYFLVELAQGLKGNTVGVPEYGSTGTLHPLILIHRDQNNGSPLGQHPVPSIVLHASPYERTSVRHLLRQWVHTERVVQDVNDELKEKLRLVNEDLQTIDELLLPVPWHESATRISRAHHLARIQSRLAQRNFDGAAIGAYLEWLNGLWEEGRGPESQTPILLGEFVHGRQVKILNSSKRGLGSIKNYLESSLSTIRQIERKSDGLKRSAAIMATSYQTQSSTAAETAGIVSAVVAILALIISGIGWKDSQDAKRESSIEAPSIMPMQKLCLNIDKEKRDNLKECTFFFIGADE